MKNLQEKINLKIEDLIKEETLISDVSFRIACEHIPEFPLFIASIITGDEIDPVFMHTQERMFNPGGREIVADVIIYSSDGCVYDIEPNTYRDGESVERGLFHSYVIGSKMLKKGEPWDRLRRCCVIMLNQHDILKRGEPVVRIESVSSDTGESASEKASQVYIVNCSYKGDGVGKKFDLLKDLTKNYMREALTLPEMKKVVEYMVQGDVQDMIRDFIREYFADELAEGRAMLRNDAWAEGLTEGRLEGKKEGRKEGRKEGIEEGRREEKYSNARELYKNGVDIEVISKSLNIPQGEMEAIVNSL